MSEKAHLDAVMALLDTAEAAPMTLQEIADAKVANPTTLPASYTEVQVMQKPGSGPRREGAPADSSQWRILTRVVAQRYANAQEIRQRAGEALHEAKLTVAGETYFIERAVTDDPISPDDGWYSGASEFAY